jgi:flagellar biosynthesis protein FlhB
MPGMLQGLKFVWLDPFLRLVQKSFKTFSSFFAETLAETIESGPLCITSVCSLFLVYNYFPINFLILLLAIYDLNFQCGRKISFAHKKLKKPLEKVAYLWQLGRFFSLQPRLPKTAQNFIFVL